VAAARVPGRHTGFADVAAERNLGRLPVLLVRMNHDLGMGDDLKKTRSGNLFTVFGEPDIEIRDVPADASADDGAERIEVEILGVDVYDPSTGEVRSHDTDHIPLWMLDSDYNEESFFVRYCYFTGGGDLYARLKRALKADIDEDAWATLYSTTSQPFPKPATGKIAVKVINDYGDKGCRCSTSVPKTSPENLSGRGRNRPNPVTPDLYGGPYGDRSGDRSGRTARRRRRRPVRGPRGVGVGVGDGA
jgi:hypothetical protein